ncbi:MAG: hypothetical protein DMF54_12620 [Acidobacteria bacterium]|nr:MAG: hypothetical protein DMF54_12620 [Acidobacteriota bacterium]
MRAVRSAIVWAIVLALTVVFGVPAIFAALVPPRGDWFLRFARGWARSVLAVAGVPVRVLHGDRLEREKSCIVVANHESFCDILVLLANLPMQVRFLAKRSIFRVPVLGWSIAAAGFVPVDREDRSRGAATVEAALERLEGGRSLVIFPEETRTSTGELLPFKRGAASDSPGRARGNVSRLEKGNARDHAGTGRDGRRQPDRGVRPLHPGARRRDARGARRDRVVARGGRSSGRVIA